MDHTTPPSSPTPMRRRVLSSSASQRPSSPTIKISGKMTLPSIATFSSSPASPHATRNFAAFHCPESPTLQRRMTSPPYITNTPNTPSAGTAATVAPAVSSSLSVSSNDREQPVATCPVAKAGGKRKLGKGCSLLDWIRLCRTKKGELGAPGGEKKPVTLAELALHNTEDDAWTAIRGEFATNVC